MAQDRFRQFARVDIGLRLAIGVVRLQVVEIDRAVEADSLHARQLGQQQEALLGIEVRIVVGPAVGSGVGKLISTISLSMQLSAGITVGFPVVAVSGFVLGGHVASGVDAESVVVPHKLVNDHITQFVVDRLQHCIQRVA
ncbi:hypothetical protein D3C75_1042200 [compost metagenome]